MHGDEKKHTAALVEAREAGVTVNMEGYIESPQLTDSEDNSDIDDDDDYDF